MMGELPLVGYALMAALCLHEAGFTVRHLLRCRYTKTNHRCTCLLSHRFLAGYPFHGYKQTDATFLRRADHTEGHVSPFQKMPGWQRRALRTGPVLAVFGALISWPLTAAAVLTVSGCWGVARWTPQGRQAVRRLRHPIAMFNRVQTTAMAVAGAAEVSPAAVQRGLELARDYANAGPGEHVLSWYPPRGFKGTGGQKTTIESILSSRIGFAMTATWDMAADRPVLEMSRTRDLPTLVYFGPSGVPDGAKAAAQRDAAADLMAKVDALPENKTAIGVDDHGGLVCWDWAIENPHGLLNAGSRHGKTEAMMGMVAQVLRKGGRVTYVDVKRTSIQGMKGVPGLTLLDNPRDMPAMWLAIAEWGKDLDRRIDDRTKDPTLEFSRDLLVIEEVNQFSEMCDEFWETWPEEHPDWHGTVLWKPKRAKRTPPIWRVVKHGVWEGAFAKKNVLIAGQNIEYRTVAGVRNSIGMRMMGAYQPQNWDQLVRTKPTPPAPMVKGRWCMINGSTQTWFQAFVAHLVDYESAAIWRDYARHGRRLDGTVPVSGPFIVNGQGTIQPPNNGWSAPRSGAFPPGPVTDLSAPMSILETVRAFILPHGTPEDQQKYAQRLRQDRYLHDRGELPDGLEFPEPAAVADDGRQTELFAPSELIEFNDVRRGSRAGR